jgi:hypothetical protein
LYHRNESRFFALWGVNVSGLENSAKKQLHDEKKTPVTLAAQWHRKTAVATGKSSRLREFFARDRQKWNCLRERKISEG